MGIRVRMGSIERLESAQEKRLGLRCFVGQRSATTSTSDLSPEAVEQLVDQTCRLAQTTAEDPFAGLPEPAELATEQPDLALWDAAAAAMTADERIVLAKRAEAAALGADPRITNSEGADCDYGGATVWYASSSGFMGSYRGTRTSLSVTPVATQDGRMQRDYWYSSGRHLAHLQSPEAIGRIAAERTLRRLGARRVKTQQAPVVFDPETAAQLLGTIASALSGYALYRRASFLVDRLGQPVAAPIVTIEDDGTIPGEVGSRPFDGEGLPTRKKRVIEAGVLASYLMDSYTARKLKLRPTGNATRGVGDSPGVAPTNLRLLPGAQSPDEIIRAVPNGLYVTELIGFGINLATGDYSQGAAGLWIDRGELASPVEEVTIAGNLGDMLMQIDAIGNDLPPHRGVASPTIRIARLTIAGE
jgi:PmbA protein